MIFFAITCKRQVYKKYYVCNGHFMSIKDITPVKDRRIKNIMSVIDIMSAKDIIPVKGRYIKNIMSVIDMSAKDITHVKDKCIKIKNMFVIDIMSTKDVTAVKNRRTKNMSLIYRHYVRKGHHTCNGQAYKKYIMSVIDISAKDILHLQKTGV